MTPHQQLTLGLLQPRSQSLDNFVPGRNAEALAVARELAGGRGPQFVYLWGPAGCGRTHLLAALGGAPEVPSWRGPGPVYAVDDVQRLDSQQQALLFALINEVRAAPSARLIAAGDAPPARLALREDVRTRLAWGLALGLEPLSEQEKADALRAQLAQRGVRAAADLVPYMLSRLPRDMRTLAAAVEALDAYALEQGRALTVPLLKDWVRAQAGRMRDE